MKFEYTTESLYILNRFEGIIRHYWSDYSNKLKPLKQFTDFEWGNSGCIANLPYLKYLEYDAFIFVGTSKVVAVVEIGMKEELFRILLQQNL